MTEKEKRTILDMRAVGKQYKEISAKLGIEVSHYIGSEDQNNLPYYPINAYSDIKELHEFITVYMEDYADLLSQYLPDFVTHQEDGLLEIIVGVLKVYQNEGPSDLEKTFYSLGLCKSLIKSTATGSTFKERLLDTHDMSTYAVWMKMNYPKYRSGDYSE